MKRFTRSTLLAYAALIVAPGAFAQHALPRAAGPAGVKAAMQQAYIKASNTGSLDEFGYAVAASGDTIVVGAWSEDSSSTGVDGNQTANNFVDSGAAYVFVRNGSTWTQQAYLKASNTNTNDFFGKAVAISGDTIVIGARFEDSNATGVNGDESDNSAPNSGAAYVYVRNGATWTQQAYLKASNTEDFDEFGVSVAVSGDTIVVGAWSEASNATGVNGNQADNSAFLSGAAYVFTRNGTTWSQQAYLKASNTGSNDLFGWSVAASGDTIAVGAYLEDSSASGVDGNQASNSLSNSGAAYVFSRSGTTWSQQAYLKASNPGASDQFGFAVAASGDTVLVGAYQEDSAATGVDGDSSSNASIDSGAAYVYARSGTTWTQQAYLKASNTGTTDLFGFAVALSGDAALVGAYQEDSSATGIDGDQASNAAFDAGGAYAFVRSGTTWSQHAYLKASNTESLDRDAFAVGLSDGLAVMGAIGEDGNSNGINGNQADNGASSSGAAYAVDLDLPSAVWTDLGFGLAGVSGVPLLVGTGTLLTGSAGTLTLSGAAPGAAAPLFVSLVGTPSPFKCGILVPVPVTLLLFLFTDGSGTIPLAWAAWPAGLSGASLYFQHGIQDAAAVCGAALSNALRADVP